MILPACSRLWCLPLCKLVILGTLAMPGHVHHNQLYHFTGNSDVYPQTKNQLDPSIFSRDITFQKNPAIWLFKNILVDNYRKNVLPDMGFAMEIQELKELSFCIVYTKIKCQNFHTKNINKSKMPYFCTHCQNLGKN